MIGNAMVSIEEVLYNCWLLNNNNIFNLQSSIYKYKFHIVNLLALAGYLVITDKYSISEYLYNVYIFKNYYV